MPMFAHTRAASANHIPSEAIGHQHLLDATGAPAGVSGMDTPSSHLIGANASQRPASVSASASSGEDMSVEHIATRVVQLAKTQVRGHSAICLVVLSAFCLVFVSSFCQIIV